MLNWSREVKGFELEEEVSFACSGGGVTQVNPAGTEASDGIFLSS